MTGRYKAMIRKRKKQGRVRIMMQKYCSAEESLMTAIAPFRVHRPPNLGCVDPVKTEPVESAPEPLRSFARKTLLKFHRNMYGWRRFFMRDWWEIKLSKLSNSSTTSQGGTE